VDGVDLLAAVLAGELEGCLGDARGALLGDDLEGLDDAGEDRDLEAGIEVLGVLAEDDEVDAGVVGLDAGERFNGAEAGVEVVLFAQRDIDGRETAADGRGRGPFDGDAVLLDGGEEGLGDEFAGAGEGVGAGIEGVPVEGTAGLCAGGFDDTLPSLQTLRGRCRRLVSA
jgi:hypothetical protein